jgi:tetratricopeptide (TPR) repeat protein
MVVDPGCMKCMDCGSVCPRDALYFGFGALPKKSAAKGKPKGRWDFTWPEEIAMAVVFLVALYAFRNLYDAVPFLLAIALSVLAAFALVLVRRLITARAIELQHHALKREGRLTGRGASALGLSSVFLAFTAHSGLVQYDEREGDRLLERAGSLPPTDAERGVLLRESLEHLRRADRLGLVDTADVQNRTGQILVALGELDAAEPRLRRAIELLPRNASARYFLAVVVVQRGAFDEACDLAEELHGLDPESDVAPRIVLLVLGRDPENDRARALLESWRPS